MAEQIAPVRRDLNIQNRLAWKNVANRRADFCLRRQDQKAECILTEFELDRAAKHPFGFNAAKLAFPNLSSVRQFRARKCKRNFVADFVIGRAANDLAFGSAAVVHFANRQTIGIGVTRRRGDL